MGQAKIPNITPSSFKPSGGTGSGGGGNFRDKFASASSGAQKRSGGIGEAFAQREAQTKGRLENLNFQADQAARAGNTEGVKHINEKIAKMPKF